MTVEERAIQLGARMRVRHQVMGVCHEASLDLIAELMDRMTGVTIPFEMRHTPSVPSDVEIERVMEKAGQTAWLFTGDITRDQVRELAPVCMGTLFLIVSTESEHSELKLQLQDLLGVAFTPSERNTSDNALYGSDGFSLNVKIYSCEEADQVTNNATQ